MLKSFKFLLLLLLLCLLFSKGNKNDTKRTYTHAHTHTLVDLNEEECLLDYELGGEEGGRRLLSGRKST